jgi:hypothetical protein
MGLGGLRHARGWSRASILLSTAALVATVLTPADAHAAAGTSARPTATSSIDSSAAGANSVTPAQALATARKTGRSVQATAETTNSSTLAANPDGTLTLTQTTAPVRKLVNGVWTNLDPTLVRRADGTISPKVTTNSLALSGGGKTALATLRAADGSLAISMPAGFTVGSPTLDGATATYHNVLPGVDLAVTAQDTGGFSEVLIVQNADAARNPALRAFALAVVPTGVTPRTDAAGNFSATDKLGRTLFTAAAPTMWDSSSPAAGTSGARDPDTGQSVNIHTGIPLRSSALTPGSAAHTARLKATYTPGRMTLTPDASFLTGADLTYPVYVDPTFTPSGQTDTQQAWAYVSSEYHTTPYWDPGASTYGPLHVGYIDDTTDVPNYISTDRSFFQTSINSGVWGATVISSTISFHENWSFSCTASEVDLYQTGTINSSTTWDAQPSWTSLLGTASVAHGHSSSCAAANVGYDIKSMMQSAANGKWTTATFGLRATATDENAHNQNSWKQFSKAATITTTYNHAPNIPTVLTTSPASSCTASAPTVFGKGDVALKAAVSDPDGTISPLTAEFTLTNMNTSVSYPQNINTTSGTTAQATYSHTSGSGPFAALSAKTEFSWTVAVTDQRDTSSALATCHFYYDPTAPGPPSIASASTPTSYCPDLNATDGNTATDNLCTIGNATGFVLTDPNTTDTAPATYLYQLNSAAPISVAAGSSASNNYEADVSIKPTRQTNTLTVSAVASTGNIGNTQIYQFLANAQATAKPGDLNGDGHADLLAVGGQDSLPAGLWLADGDGSNSADSSTTNIGIDGNGVSQTAQAPSSFNASQAITGHFHTGAGFNDVLDYSYDTGTGAVSAEILYGQGDGTSLNPIDALPVTDATSVFTLSPTPSTTYHATSIANGGGLYNYVSNGDDASTITGYPDLLLVVGGSLYDEPSIATSGAYVGGGLADSTDLADYNPYCLAQNAANNNTACTADWTGWTITSALDSTGLPELFARDTSAATSDPSAGQLWYFASATLQNLDGDALSNNVADTAFTSIEAASSGWDATSEPFLQAADINGDATPDLWTLNSAGVPASHLMTIIGTSATWQNKTGTALNTSTHDWPLTDYASQTANDFTSGTALPLTGAGGVIANNGDQFDPDVQLDGSTGMLATSGSAPAVTTNSSFTISAWANPTATGGTVASQKGTYASGFELYLNSASQWSFCMAQADTTTTAYDCATAASPTSLGAWSHLTATYNQSTTVMSLYVNDIFVGTANHTAVTGFANTFALGRRWNAGAATGYLAGQLAQVQTWSGSALAPAQPYTPPAYHQALTPTRLLDTRGALGDTLTNRGTAGAATPVPANSTLTLQIIGDTVTPAVTGAPTTIPPTATAVAIDLTVVSPTAGGDVIAYPDGAQRPITSGANYATGATVTGYAIVPIGLDQKIALYNASTGTTHILVDITGYYTTDATLTGDQRYHPLATAYRALDTRNGTGGTTGTLAAGAALNLQITGIDNIPSTATAVAINLTTAGETGSGYLQTYAAGTTPGNITSLTYTTSALASMSADVPLGTTGQITIRNIASSAATHVIGDISGYYEPYSTTSSDDTGGETYHAVNPTRLVDTRSGIGGTTATHTPIPAAQNYTLSQATTAQIATTANPTLTLNLTATQGTVNGDLIAYPAGPTLPTTSNLNFNAGQDIANLTLTTTGTGTSAGQIDIYNQSTGTVHIVIDCSGYFTAS